MAVAGRGKIKIAIGLLVVLGVVLFFALGGHRAIDPSAFRAWLRGAGPVGILAFLGLYAALQPLGVPSDLFLFSAGAVWSWPVAFAAAWTGSILCCFPPFLFARYIARDWVQERVPERLRRLDDALVERGFRTVLILRGILFTAQWLTLGLGVSKVSMRAHLLGSALGNLPRVAVGVLLGRYIVEYLEAHPVGSWAWEIIVPCALAVLIVGYFVYAKLTKRAGRTQQETTAA